MKGAQVSEDQWVIRLRDLLTGQVMKPFQDLSADNRLSFTTVRDKLLASKNLTTEGCHKRFQQAIRPGDKSFGDFVNDLRTKSI